MSVKTSLKKLIRNMSGEYSNKPESRREKTKDTIHSLTFAGSAAFLIITFVVRNTRIPAGSTEDTIPAGDFVLVNKIIYVASFPRFIPFTRIPMTYFSLPAFRESHRNDTAVFKYPGSRDQMSSGDRGVNYLKRCIGLTNIFNGLIAGGGLNVPSGVIN